MCLSRGSQRQNREDTRDEKIKEMGDIFVLSRDVKGGDVSQPSGAPWNALADQDLRKHLYLSSCVCRYGKQIWSFLGFRRRVSKLYKALWNVLTEQGRRKHLYFSSCVCRYRKQIGSFLGCRREVSELYKAMWNVLTDQFIRKHLYCYRRPFCTL